MSDLTVYRTFVSQEGHENYAKAANSDFEKLSSALIKLPRITREFLALMIKRRESERRHGLGGSDQMEINADKLARISRYPDTTGELRLLETYAFIFYEEPIEQNESGY